jgi:tetratricopeptide (TPR) repeat protein
MAMDVATQAEAAFQQALRLHGQSRFDEAHLLYEQAARLQPQHVQALVFLGVIALQQNLPERAIQWSSKALQRDPRSAAAHLVLGQAQYQLHRREPAIASFDRAIALKPDLAEAHFQRGNALRELKKYAAALASHERASALMPESSEAHYNCALAHSDLGQHAAALASYDRAIAIRADHADAFCNRGNVLYRLGRLEEALASYSQVIALKPDYAMAHCNRGNVLHELNESAASLASYEQAIAINADCAEAHSNRGNVLRDLKQLDAALASYNRALAVDPEYAVAHFNRAFLRLLTGDYQNGWIDYEWRWKNEGSRSIEEKRSFAQPRWSGDESISGKTILIHREQGLGDVLQFCRYAKLLSEMGAKVILEVHQSLISALACVEGVSHLIERGGALPQFDCWCPLLSLPLALKTNLLTIPSPGKYLHADAAKVAWWQAKLTGSTRPRIGLAWSGSALHPNDRNRSLALIDVIRHLPDGAHYVSLQKEVRASDRVALQSNPQIFNPADDLHDFSDTAALCECLDLLISVDTSIAHLGGALGRATWILLPYSPDWRWLLDRDDSPWYSAVKLYRQDGSGAWHSVLRRVRADLSRMIATSQSK